MPLLITAECEKSFPFMPFELGYEAVQGLPYCCLVRQATENRAQSMKCRDVEEMLWMAVAVLPRIMPPVRHNSHFSDVAKGSTRDHRIFVR